MSARQKPVLVVALMFCAVCSVLSGSTQAVNQKVEICFTLDSSASMWLWGDPNGFELQQQSLANAVSDPAIIPRDGTVAISVVRFSSDVMVEVPRTLIDSEATASAVVARINAIEPSYVETAIGDAIAACAGTFKFDAGWKQVIDISTDGGQTPGLGIDPQTAADAAVTAGVDAINAIAVMNNTVDPDADKNYAELKTIVRPQPSKAIGQGDGFVIRLTTFDDYAAALEQKIRYELQPQPLTDVPTMSEWGLIIMCLLFGGSAFFSMRKGVKERQ
jgi:hypothetical protein